MSSQYCGGSKPNNAIGTNLVCYKGYASSKGGGSLVPATSSSTSSDFAYCVGVTVTCPVLQDASLCQGIMNGTSVRYSTGMSVYDFNGPSGVRVYGLNPSVYSDVTICSTSLCNSPPSGDPDLPSDTCGLSQQYGMSYVY